MKMEIPWNSKLGWLYPDKWAGDSERNVFNKVYVRGDHWMNGYMWNQDLLEMREITLWCHL